MKSRKSSYPVNELILNRWSPRAMDPKKLVTKKELMSLFEAARWAQSSFNNQPWRFIYVQRDTPDWPRMFNLMVAPNQLWAKNASYLVLAISRNNFAYNNKYSRTHSFDTGAACQNFALEGHNDGLVVHGMEGFDYDKARTEFHVPKDYTIEAMFAVGKPGDIKNLPEELQKKEFPSDRNPIETFAFENDFHE